MGKKKHMKEMTLSKPQACAGKSIIEILEEELDAIVERLMHGAESEDDKGMAQGVAYCLAVFRNPYLPDIEAVREAAMERFEVKEDE